MYKSHVLRFSYLTNFEDMLVQVKLKIFIGQVDAELFKAVSLEIFKSKNVKHSNRKCLQNEEENDELQI